MSIVRIMNSEKLCDRAYFYIKKENREVTKEELQEACGIYPWTLERHKEDNKPIPLWFGYGDEFDYKDNFYIIADVNARLQFAYASYFNDDELNNWIKEQLPMIEDFSKISTYRNGFNLREFLNENNITVQDFIMNDKYVVVLDDGIHWGKLVYSYLVDLDVFTEETAYQPIDFYGSID
ncbi:MAG: hypothetical protein IJS58_00540 [Bacilli bacterium]|nr:hypothetical protein [Bacilli bacterium]